MILIPISGSWTTVIEHAVIGMSFDVLLQILRALEIFSAEGAAMRLERDMNANMRGDVIALHHLSAT